MMMILKPVPCQQWAKTRVIGQSLKPRTTALAGLCTRERTFLVHKVCPHFLAVPNGPFSMQSMRTLSVQLVVYP